MSTSTVTCVFFHRRKSSGFSKRNSDAVAFRKRSKPATIARVRGFGHDLPTIAQHARILACMGAKRMARLCHRRFERSLMAPKWPQQETTTRQTGRERRGMQHLRIAAVRPQYDPTGDAQFQSDRGKVVGRAFGVPPPEPTFPLAIRPPLKASPILVARHGKQAPYSSQYLGNCEVALGAKRTLNSAGRFFSFCSEIATSSRPRNFI